VFSSEESDYTECYFVSLGGSSLDAYQCVEDIFHHYSTSHKTHFYISLEVPIKEQSISNPNFTCSGELFVDLYNFELVDAQRRYLLSFLSIGQLISVSSFTLNEVVYVI
jgi:hypothetical protein